MTNKIGFMQGRLSPIINNKIQAFPWPFWENEFEIANSIGLKIMEWTLDSERLYENPLMTSLGQNKIKDLIEEYKVQIPSLTGDCFMQTPFWKCSQVKERKKLQEDFEAILISSKKIGIKLVVVPLVDNGKIENRYEEDLLVSFLDKLKPLIIDLDMRIIFESDFNPTKLATFISQFDEYYFGINYDLGNSASYGFNPVDEFEAIGKRIFNVHIKDRCYGGPTLPLGEGDVDFELVFKLLIKNNNSSNLILQTSRASEDQHISALIEYKKFVEEALSKNESKH